ncbi:16S rRNA (cytidine(1402)-2'-O)-methyltransferase [Acidithiobacillus sulfuriphilus]|uniref:Ribosomal RNA small subunit methyltransferase I n=2 Tax=Acidithiobacillus sulfuriphilus TaxID=1867749 RepID=A0A3M8SEC8_9PROT|nr:16S rRNA (cytidine(1402)-2'-O)-methyltransferase [Acidithiobacillus sulfuriphilus]RNF77342.1 16S rRNA (cytidine(1402)-2'-O)-methyltransferase [Acidithiobacillus sulfuriphilus]
MQEQSGQLTIIGTPIGNLDDLSPRAARAMAEAELILVEDSRHAQRLFRHLGLQPKTLALHEHNERDLAPRIAERIAAGERIALLSDAGMPLLSDPGYPLLAALRARQLPVRVIPGPNAALAALVLSGLPSDRFAFEGFLPAKGAARRVRLDALRAEPRTLIFYEAPHRIAATLQDMVAAFGAQRPAALCRELTKIYEECLRHSLGDLLALFAAAPEKLRGEMTLVVAGAPEAAPDQALADRVLTPLLAELPLAQAVRLAAALSGIPHRVLYELALEKKRAMNAE